MFGDEPRGAKEMELAVVLRESAMPARREAPSMIGIGEYSPGPGDRRVACSNPARLPAMEYAGLEYLRESHIDETCWL